MSAPPIPTLVLYGMGSPNVRKVGILLEELELDYELRHVGVMNSEQFAPAFVAMNPFAKVPVLVDPALEVPLFESGAILFYLAEKHGRFLPGANASDGGAARYEVMAWLTAQMANVGPLFGQLNHFRLLPEGSERYAEARYAAQSERLYGILNDRLADREWIAGSAYSIADIATYPWAHYLERHRFAAADYPHLIRWRAAIDARPAIARSNARFDALADISTQGRRTASAADVDRFFWRTEKVPPADYSALLRL